MATLSVAHSAMESRTTEDSTWRDRSTDFAGKYASTRYKYSSTSFDFSGSATKIEFVLPYYEDTNYAFTTSLYVGNSSVGDVGTIPSKCTKIGTFPATIGDNQAIGTLTLAITDTTTINTFLTKIKSDLYIYIYGSNRSQATVIECQNSFRVNITYDSNSGGSSSFSGATPYIWKATQTQYKYPEAPMTSDESQNCKASASSYYDDTRRPYWCFDLSNETTAWWSSSNATGPWVQLIMPRALYNIKVTLTNRNVDYARGLITGGIYGTNDGDDTTLTSLVTISGRDGNTAAASTTHSCGNTSVAYNTVRVKFTKWGANSSGETNFASLGEIEITGTDVPSGGGWLKATPYVYNGGWQVVTANVAG